jgi:transaldolase
MKRTSIQQLADFGQSVWLDYISRPLMEGGKLARMIELGLRGMTSNPAIFNRAIGESDDYDALIERLAPGRSPFDVYDELSVGDIRKAADIFLPVYRETGGLDGYVSLEIDPRLAYKIDETVAEGKRLAAKVDRPNVMFKVPATGEGMRAVEELTAAGMNINVTLIFGVSQYRAAAAAYLRGVERFLQRGGEAGRVRSVASVFASRIDTLADRLLAESPAGKKDAARVKALQGRAAVANCRLIYKAYLDLFSGSGFAPLRARGANVQRVLWGSTGTKNPAYSDIKYVTELIGKGTVNTVPEKTFEAFLARGEVRESLTADTADAPRILAELNALGIDMDSICARLLDEGVALFTASFEALLASIEKKAARVSAPR